jgi:hypothetical protein
MEPTVSRLEIGELVRQQQLGRGGHGVVTRVTTRLAPHTPLAFKEYLPWIRPTVHWPVLGRLVSLYGNADEATQAWINEHTAWPTTIVTDSGQPCGYLMRLAPAGSVLPSREGPSVPLAIEFLLNPQPYLRLIGLRFGLRYALGVLRSLAEILDRLHGLGVAVGDLSPKNLLVGSPPDARCFLLDCDSVRLSGASAIPPAETPDWVAPSTLRPEDADVYKLALFAVRLAAGDQSTRDLAAMRVQFPTLADISARSLAADLRYRPDAAAWVAELDRALRDVDRRIAAARTRVPTRPAIRPGRWWGWPWVAAALAVSALMAGVTGLVRSDRPFNYGVVGYTDVARDQRAEGIARLLDSYFGAINAHRPDVARSAIDDRATTAYDAIRLGASSQYSDVRIVQLSDSGEPDVAVFAVTQFRTSQPAGLGPARNPYETCTHWLMTYAITDRPQAGYRILRGDGSSEPC